MTIKPMNTFHCPLDGEPLEHFDRQLKCSHGHCFDIAKRGYCNLLPAQFKRSKEPGDSKAMIEARHRFLEHGFYRLLAQSLADMSSTIESPYLLDAGCGEGYYLRQLESFKPNITWNCCGLDISKPAIDAAAKYHKNCSWMVASNANIPLPDASVDVLWCVFGFPHLEEFLRVLKPGGRLIQVDAGTNHLLELRKIIYPNIKQKPTAAMFDDHRFTNGRNEEIDFSIDLERAHLADLLLMTPHLFRANAERREQALSLEHLKCQAHMLIRELIKEP